MVIGPLIWALLGARSMGVFLLGCVVGAISVQLFHSPQTDSLVGVSGGVFALFAYLVAAAYLDSRLLPKGMGLLLGVGTALSLLLGELVSANISTQVHLVGLVIGIAAAFATIKKNHRHDRHIEATAS